ncbi:putative glycerol-3-phosphate 2-O-acyltransferase 6-like [Capsicum annuum]|nr:putative glycerol-3-phosphate 2-O-acyltransferase 6-like [Capsicum annuum]
MKHENIGRLFKRSCFGCFLELPEDPSAHIHFSMMMVYGLLKRRIKYAWDDKDLEEGGEKKMDEIWINYCGMTILYDFPWAFMAWEFEAIPPFQKQLMDYPDEVSHPRMLRWLAAKSNTNIKEADLFNHPNDAIRLLQVVHPWIVPTEEESVMTSYITLGHVDTIAYPTVELIKKELVGATAIRRAVRQGQTNVEALHEQPFTKADPGTSFGGVVSVGGRHADAATTHDDEYVDSQERINMFENTSFLPYTGPSHPSSPSYSRCECKECKDRRIDSLKK